jgi:hypothetical protein
MEETFQGQQSFQIDINRYFDCIVFEKAVKRSIKPFFLQSHQKQTTSGRSAVQEEANFQESDRKHLCLGKLFLVNPHKAENCRQYNQHLYQSWGNDRAIELLFS